MMPSTTSAFYGLSNRQPLMCIGSDCSIMASGEKSFMEMNNVKICDISWREDSESGF